MKKTGMENIRLEIRHKDRDIVRLLNERARLSQEVGKIKGQEGDRRLRPRPGVARPE